MTDKQNTDQKKAAKQNAGRHNKGSWLNTVKWVAICITTITLALILYKAYRISTAPVRAAQSVGSSVAGAASDVMHEAENIAGGRDVDIDKGREFDHLSENAFAALTKIPQSKPENMTEQIFRAANLRGSDNRICRLSLDFGAGPITIFAAANNQDYATSRDLGSKENRIIRIHVFTNDSPLGLRAYWDLGEGKWKMRWRRAMVSRPISDQTARARLKDVLREIPKACPESP